MATRTGWKISPVNGKVKEERKVAKNKTSTTAGKEKKHLTKDATPNNSTRAYNTKTSATRTATDKYGKVVSQKTVALTPVTKEEFVGNEKFYKKATRKTR